MLTAIQTVGSKDAYNMLVLRSKWLSNSEPLYFSELLELEKVYVRFLVNKTFKIVGCVLKGVFRKVKNYFIKYFFRD